MDKKSREQIHYRRPRSAQELVDLAQAAYGQSPWSLTLFERDLASRLTDYLVAEDKGEVLAFVGGTLVIDELSISNVAVRPRMQGQGLATGLVRRWLRGFPAQTRVLLEVRVSNIPAQRLYQKLGFQVYATRTAYYREPLEDAYMMEGYLPALWEENQDAK